MTYSSADATEGSQSGRVTTDELVSDLHVASCSLPSTTRRSTGWTQNQVLPCASCDLFGHLDGAGRETLK